MNMMLKKSTSEELREALHYNLIDLFSDVLLLDCFLFAAQDGGGLEEYCTPAILAETAKLLNDQIAQHAAETAQIASFLLFPKEA